MHHKITETQITRETGSISSDSSSASNTATSIHHKHLQFESQSYPQSQPQTLTHVQLQIPLLPISSPNPPPTLLTQHQHQHQPHFHFHHDQQHPVSNNPSTTQPLLSSPHRRPTIMTLSPSSLSLSSTLSSLRTHPQSNFSPESSFVTLFSIKTIAYRLFFRLSRARLLCVHLRVLVLISLPSLYFFLSNPNRFFSLNFVSVLAFSITLLVSLNLAFPRLPSFRLLLSRSLPNKLNSTNLATKPSKPIIWTIGSKPKVEKRPSSGSWVQVYSNGDVYEGEFHKGKCSGSGVYYYNMSGRYEGDWVDEKYDGHGVETWAKGSRYRGQYRQGLRHGIGVYRFYSGDVYAGEWSNGQCHGCGIHTCEDGSRYVGEFKWGVKHGLGRYHFRNGDTYAGEYFADRMHGFGVYQFGNGHRYEGAWHEGRRQGLGMYTFRNGEVQSGHWQNGFLDVPISENSLNGSPYAVTHSKICYAVQEAQQAATRACEVARIDERVNKTVAAANKAANAARVAAVKAVQRQMPNDNSDNVPNHCV